MTATRRPKPPAPSKLERELEDAMLQYTDAAGLLEEATVKRDQLIRKAITGGLPRARIVTVTQLSPQRIDQIRRNARL